MDLWIATLAIAGAILIGAVSPGPSFVIVARTAVSVSRSDGLATALGMGVGGLVFAAAALMGLQAVLTAAPWLYFTLKVAGAAYLLYLAVRVWRGARQPLDETCGNAGGTRGFRKSFAFGLVTQLSNPKTAVWYASVFSAALAASPPQGLLWVILPTIFLIEAGWYALVAIAFSSPAPRRSYLRLKPWADRAAAGVMGLLGLKLFWDAR